jgi:dihydrofolate synthase/folylpolyglutamate synthase
MSKASLSQWLDRLEKLHPNEMDLGLERVGSVAQNMQLVPVSVPVIAVSGTNGKGSTSAVLEAVLVELGLKVGVCSSPHFERFNERIRVGGVEVADSSIVDAFEQIDLARGATSLTYFEFATLAALVVFREVDVDIMVLEVGLGGRLDAVNIVDASVAVLTSIGLDHQQWLGDTRELIAVEKAGIFRRGGAAVIAEPDPPISLIRLVDEGGVNALYIGRDFFIEESATAWKGAIRKQDGSRRELPELEKGALLPANILAAMQALSLVGVEYDDEVMRSALSRLRLPGRRECREVAGRSYLLDVAHNLAAIDKLLEHIDTTSCNKRIFALFSVMKDKDIQGMVQACSGKFEAWFLADQPDNPRASSADELAKILREEGNDMISISSNIRQAFRRAQSVMSTGDLLVVFGSFFTVAAVMPLLDKDCKKEAQ